MRAILALAKLQLAHTDNPDFEAHLLLAEAMNLSRAQLVARDDQRLTEEQYHQFSDFVKRRALGEPIAYILGRKSFWDVELMVTPDVLIPRPETELIVEWILAQSVAFPSAALADLGTGSGAIAIAIAKARPNWLITATDISAKALQIAKQNAEKYHVKNIDFYSSDWCQALTKKSFNFIVSNPPYIDPNDQHLNQGDLRFEPKCALIAQENGLADLFCLVKEAKTYLKPLGYLVLEHGYAQAAVLQEYAIQEGYFVQTTLLDLAGHDRVTVLRI